LFDWVAVQSQVLQLWQFLQFATVLQILQEVAVQVKHFQLLKVENFIFKRF
jgi:hypothetical protein